MSVVALIPLRGGSKSIPNKNIKQFLGKPLCAWVLQAAISTKDIDSVYVSTDSDLIASVVNDLRLGVNILPRPPELGLDDSSTESVLTHFASIIPFDDLITIQATSPILMPTDLTKALDLYRRDSLDSLLSAVRTKRFFWNDDATPINYDPRYRPRRQEFLGTYMENGAFYITKREIIEGMGCRLGGKVGIYQMDDSSSVEIDEPEDWELAEKKLAQKITLDIAVEH